MAWKPSKEDMMASVLTLIQCRNHVNLLIETKKLYTGDKGRLAKLATLIELEEDHLLVRHGRRLAEEENDSTV